MLHDSFFAPGATINVNGGLASRGASTAIDPDIAALAGRFGGGGGSAPVAAVSSPVVTLTVEQARAAAPGTIFLGIDGKQRRKNADGTVSIIVQ